MQRKNISSSAISLLIYLGFETSAPGKVDVTDAEPVRGVVD